MDLLILTTTLGFYRLSPSSESYDCSKIRKAFMESLSILGLPALDALIVELEDMGVFLGRKCSTLGQIAEALRYMYGEETAEMMMQRVFLKLDEICWTGATSEDTKKD